MKKYLYIGAVLLIIGFSVWAYIANASNTGTTNPGTMANDASVGTLAWNTPDNAKTPDLTYAEFPSASPSTVQSHYLNATNFGFAIPTGATIDGILVEIEKSEVPFSFGVFDTNVRIIKADGTKGTTNKALPTEWDTSDFVYVSYGASNDLWGETWTAADINDVDFGVAISANSKDTYGYVDHIRITVYYTGGAGGAQQSATSMMMGSAF